MVGPALEIEKEKARAIVTFNSRLRFLIPSNYIFYAHPLLASEAFHPNSRKKMHAAQISVESRLEKLNFAVVGLARNCETTIERDLLHISDAMKNVGSITWLVVESDSTDNTVANLDQISSKIKNFYYSSLGNLRDSIKKRTERIAFCRNYYVKQLRENEIFSNLDYVVVADLDGLNAEFSKAAFESCWLRNDWDMCAANQDGPYYDIWALRHPIWSPGDCWAQYNFFARYAPDPPKNLYASVHSKMITIPKSDEWIEVDSAFGGLAIYKKSLFDFSEYIGINESGDEVCEHVSFNQTLRCKGARLYINPLMTNAKLTEHTQSIIR
jgi:glycosyltransferase involved in cell wall biosynthesis